MYDQQITYVSSNQRWTIRSAFYVVSQSKNKATKKRRRPYRLPFLRATAVLAGTAEARISYGNSVRPSVCPSRPGGIPSPGEIETPGLHHMIA